MELDRTDPFWPYNLIKAIQKPLPLVLIAAGDGAEKVASIVKGHPEAVKSVLFLNVNVPDVSESYYENLTNETLSWDERTYKRSLAVYDLEVAIPLALPVTLEYPGQISSPAKQLSKYWLARYYRNIKKNWGYNSTYLEITKSPRSIPVVASVCQSAQSMPNDNWCKQYSTLAGCNDKKIRDAFYYQSQVDLIKRVSPDAQLEEHSDCPEFGSIVGIPFEKSTLETFINGAK